MRTLRPGLSGDDPLAMIRLPRRSLSVHGQLADKQTRRNCYNRFGSRRNVTETMKVALFRSSLERRGGINVRSFILNVSQLIGVKYETRSGRKGVCKINPYAYFTCP